MSESKEITLQVLRHIETSEQLGLLTMPIIDCTTKAFGHSMTEDEVESALKGTLVVIARDTDLVVGYATLHKKQIEEYKHGELELSSEDSAYYSLGAGVVDSEFQGRGIYSQLNNERIQEVVRAKTSLLTTTTQNPRVEKGVLSTLQHMIEQGVLSSFEVKRIKLDGFYGRRLTSYQLKISSGPFEDLDMEAGDAYSLQFHLKY